MMMHETTTMEDVKMKPLEMIQVTHRYQQVEVFDNDGANLSFTDAYKFCVNAICNTLSARGITLLEDSVMVIVQLRPDLYNTGQLVALVKSTDGRIFVTPGILFDPEILDDLLALAVQNENKLLNPWIVETPSNV